MLRPRPLRTAARLVAASAATLLVATGSLQAQLPRITFADFHTTTATFKCLKDVAAAYPATMPVIGATPAGLAA